MKARLSIEAPSAGPGVTALIAKTLKEKGAKVIIRDKTVSRDLKKMKPVKSLNGLTVVIDRITWVREEEAARWPGKNQPVFSIVTPK